jgi:aclacinomycin oxidase
VFSGILRNFAQWYERNSAPDAPATELFSILFVTGRGQRGVPSVTVLAEVDPATPGAEQLLLEHLQAVQEAGGPSTDTGNFTAPAHILPPEQTFGPGHRHKYKAGYLRRTYTDEQLATIWRHLGEPGAQPYSSTLLLEGYGGRVNAVTPGDTALVQRDSVLKALFWTIWPDEADDNAALTFTREWYRDVYAATGGVPVPNEVSDGSYINYPDVDLADPAWNTSGVPWHTLYYKENYPRLQAVKAKWDPRNVFRHALSIQPPSIQPPA